MKTNITCPPAARLARELNIDEQTAAQLRRELKAGFEPGFAHWSHAAFEWFERCAKIADFVCGVESLHPARPELLYFNAGDSYATTLIYNHHQGRVTVGTWADAGE
jgi:hypothetical protein